MTAFRSCADTKVSLLMISLLLLFQSSFGDDQAHKHKPSIRPDENVSKPGLGSWTYPKPDEKPPHEHHREDCNCNCRCNCQPPECPPNKAPSGLMCAPINCDPAHGCNIGDVMNMGAGANFNMPFFGAVRPGAPQADTKSGHNMNHTAARRE